MLTGVVFILVMLVGVPIGLCLCIGGIAFIVSLNNPVLYQSYPLQMFGGMIGPSVADARAENLGAEAADVVAAQQQQALSERQGDLSVAASAISEESKYLKERAVFLRPTAGAVGSHYGPRYHPILHYTRLHDGLDIGGACGQPIVAASDGVVIKAAMGGYNGGSGNNVRVDDGDINGVNVQTAYLHMQTIAVSVGQQVQKGDLLGTVGSTGLSTACHLHFSVYENGTGVDPEKYLTIS